MVVCDIRQLEFYCIFIYALFGLYYWNIFVPNVSIFILGNFSSLRTPNWIQHCLLLSMSSRQRFLLLILVFETKILLTRPRHGDDAVFIYYFFYAESCKHCAHCNRQTNIWIPVHESAACNAILDFRPFSGALMTWRCTKVNILGKMFILLTFAYGSRRWDQSVIFMVDVVHHENSTITLLS